MDVPHEPSTGRLWRPAHFTGRRCGRLRHAESDALRSSPDPPFFHHELMTRGASGAGVADAGGAEGNDDADVFGTLPAGPAGDAVVVIVV